jgi:hypothetical protein
MNEGGGGDEGAPTSQLNLLSSPSICRSSRLPRKALLRTHVPTHQHIPNA